MKRIYIKPECLLLDEELEMSVLYNVSAVKVEDGNGNGMSTGGDGEGDARGYSFFEDDDF